LSPEFERDTLINPYVPADKVFMTAVRLLVFAPIILGTAFAQRVGAPTDDLDKLSVDELFTLQVTSVGRKAQQLSKAPAAVFVLTAEDIKRSGATCIPEALQWVPGLTVFHLDGRSWGVSARGSGRIYANEILVMIDGRSLYTPLFSGVIWDAIDVPLDSIERIEVVRGPGAVMWGANAVNGVINIITKRAQDTKGIMLGAATGNELRAETEARVGEAPSDKLAYRFWGKFDYRTPAYGSPGYYYFDTFTYRDPSIRNLDSATGRFGFRFDGQPTKKDQWMVQGDLYKLNRQDPVAYPAMAPSADTMQGHTDYEGGYIQASWTHTTSPESEGVLQFSYDKNNINYPFVGADLNNLTVDYQKRTQTGERNEIYWGVGYQQYWDQTYTQRFVGFDPLGSVYRTGDVVVRDEWQIVPGRLVGSAGVRVEYNTYSHLQYQPSFRLCYTPSLKQSAWMAVSRALRTPTRFDRDLVYDGGTFDAGGVPIMLLTLGSDQARPEIERSVEAGYRRQWGQQFSIDASVFWSYYNRLRATDSPTEPQLLLYGGVPILALPLTIDNAGRGRSYGGEVWATWQVRPFWRLVPSYSYVRDSRWLPSSQDVFYEWDHLPSDLRHQALLRSQFDLPRHFQLDVMARARSRDLAYQIPGSLFVDVRLGWRPTRGAEFSVALRDLTDRQVIDCASEGANPAIPLRRTFVFEWKQRI
jgi:iron complex outermembrane receptor protein